MKDKLEPNMYVRTLKGIVKIDEIKDGVMKDTKGCLHYGDFIKSGHNIIDLIDVGDCVNGWRVNRVEKEEDGTLLTIGTITSFVSRNETEPYLTQDYKEADKMCKIKSIVTKEQFESIEYRLGDNK